MENVNTKGVILLPKMSRDLKKRGATEHIARSDKAHHTFQYLVADIPL